MRTCDSSYDTRTSGVRCADPGEGKYALVSEHAGPCSLVGEYASLAAAIEAAASMDTDLGPTELEDELGIEAESDAELIEAAEAAGWRVVASAGAGECWTVLAAPGAA